MGLDQYAYVVWPHKDNDNFGYYWNDENDPNGEKVTKLTYWRKHANLQGYMENLWISKRSASGNPVEPDTEGWFAGEIVFNCQPLRLTFQDLKELKEAIVNSRLPHTTGFFFGESDEEHDKETLDFIDKAMIAIAQDMEIYYSSWW